jgi:hypothetical protein
VRQADTFLRGRGTSLEAATRADLEAFMGEQLGQGVLGPALSGRHGSAAHSTSGPASAIPPLTCPVGLDRRCWSGSRWLA